MGRLFKRYLLPMTVVILFLASSKTASSCTVITTSTDDTIWFGYNEDRELSQFDQETYLKFHKATSEDYAYMEVTAENTEIFSLRIGVNEYGVAISGNGLPTSVMNPHPEKQYSWRYHSIYNIILRKCQNILDVIEIAKNFDFNPEMSFQAHISDRNGNAIVISPGSDGEIAITHKNYDYFISTNKNRWEIEKGEYDTRDSLANIYLKNSNKMEKENIKGALDVTSVDGNEAVTYYSSIIDLTNLYGYFYLLHDYDTEISFDIQSELQMNDHQFMLIDLFPNGRDKMNHAETRMRQLNTIFLMFRILTVLGAILLLIPLILKIRKLGKIHLSMTSKALKISQFVLGYILLTVFLLLNASLLPVFVFTNYLHGIFVTHVITQEVWIFLIVWAAGLLFVGIALLNQRRVSIAYKETSIVTTK